nr:MAG TPA: hypothetical protein [Caudoviricetes sp.]
MRRLGDYFRISRVSPGFRAGSFVRIRGWVSSCLTMSRSRVPRL